MIALLAYIILYLILIYLSINFMEKNSSFVLLNFLSVSVAFLIALRFLELFLSAQFPLLKIIQLVAFGVIFNLFVYSLTKQSELFLHYVVFALLIPVIFLLPFVREIAVLLGVFMIIGGFSVLIYKCSDKKSLVLVLSGTAGSYMWLIFVISDILSNNFYNLHWPPILLISLGMLFFLRKTKKKKLITQDLKPIWGWASLTISVILILINIWSSFTSYFFLLSFFVMFVNSLIILFKEKWHNIPSSISIIAALLLVIYEVLKITNINTITQKVSMSFAHGSFLEFSIIGFLFLSYYIYMQNT